MGEEILEEIDGSIHSIHVRNFFCHENLEINLNRNVNFIVGRNGSGKSAILTALVVGLGGRASATNRGNNLHSFIKKGANSATVEIKIRNNSPKAFKPNIYGDSITIVRNINASGGSSYKVKSASGEVISTKFEEVNAIILAHDIQVDNPISVLNQDDARSFHASDAKKKYSLFRKATNLDQTETNYNRALENCNKAIAIWNRKNEACIELEKEYKKWKTSHEQLQSRDEIEAKKERLQNEYYWSEIADFEREAVLIQSQYDKQKAKIEALVEKLDKMNQNFGNNSETIDTLKAQLEEKTLEKTAMEQELRALESESRKAQSEWRAAQHTASKHTDLLNREKRKVTDIEREINNIDSGHSAQKRAELEREASEAEEAVEAVTARYNTMQHDAAQALQHLQLVAARRDRAASAAQRSRDTLKQLKQLLREVESRGHDALAVYGGNMVELCRLVKQAAARGEFSAPPRGPVGSYIKVKDKKWGGALEHIIGGSITSFCVNSAEDSRKLFEIMGKVYGKAGKPGVTCSKFLSRRHDVAGRGVRAAPHHAALEALVVSDPVVANFLVDTLAVERVLLVEEHDDAVRLSDTVENVPENCARVVTLDGSEYYPAPAYRCYGGAARAPRYLQASTADRKRQLQAEIQEMEETLRAQEAEEAQLSEESRTAREAERDAARALQALLGERHQRERAARAARDALATQRAPHHAVLLEELNVTKEKLNTLNEQLEAHMATEARLKQKIDENEAETRRVKGRLAKATSTCRSLSEEIDQEQLKLDQGASERQTCSRKLQEGREKLAQVFSILEEKQAQIDKLTQEALLLCPRVENPRDRAIVTNELKKTQLKLSSIRSDGLSKAQVAEKLLEAERRYRRTKVALARLKQLIAEIQNTSSKHLNFCHTVQTYIARRVQYCFQSILTLRGYSGRMDIDNAAGSLQITCSGRETAGQRRAASTSSLSGGERSYSTVAFIMALWECVELPFYFMDEFDVFMDNVNRKIVMELLIDHALKNTNRQFVFLTPQDASAVTASQQISIHLMPDPRP